MVTFLFSVHTITEAKQYAGLGRAETGRFVFQPGQMTWCSAVPAERETLWNVDATAMELWTANPRTSPVMAISEVDAASS